MTRRDRAAARRRARRSGAASSRNDDFVRWGDDQRQVADAGHAVAGLARELRVLVDGDRVDRDVERVDVHPMAGPLVVRAIVRPHRKLAGRHTDEARDRVLPHL